MSLSPGLSKQTNDNIRYGPSSSYDGSPFGINSGVKNYIPGQEQTTPDTELNESFLSSPSLSSRNGIFPVPSTIFYQDVPSPSSEPEPEESPTQLEAAGMVVDINNNNNNKRKADTTPSTQEVFHLVHQEYIRGPP